MDQKLEDLKNLAEQLPEKVKANAVKLVELMGTKLEGIGDQPIEWRPENLRVIQPSSDRSKLPKGTNIGDIRIGEQTVKQPLKTIPLRVWDSRQMWSPDKDEARVICSSPDGVLGFKYGKCKECEHSKFDEEAGRSACNKGKTVLSITADLTTVFITNFTKTNYKNGFDWQAMMRKANVAPFKRVYELKTETSKKYKNVEALMVDTQNETTSQDLIPFLEGLFTKFGEDRDVYLKKFHEMVHARRTDQALLPSVGEKEETVTTTEALPTPEQGAMAKKYEL